MKPEIRHNGMRTLLLAGAASVALLLGACDAAVFKAPNEDTTGTDGTVLTDPDAIGDTDNDDLLDIIATAEAAGSFTTLLVALEAANLRDTLADANNINTVFAPTDAAFDVLGEQAITDLLADSARLTDTLLYHVLAGSNDAAAVTLLAGSTVTMLNGKDAAVTQVADQLRINTSTITVANIAASNGIIHVIDAVLLPASDAPAPTNNLAQLASDDPQFTTLVTALQTTGLDATLATDGPFTVFAPNNAAFDALGEETLNALIADPDALRDILLYHVVQGQVIDSATAISAAGNTINSAAGPTLAVSLNGDNLMINNSTVVRADLNATNGVIHEIDSVLLPPTGGSTTPSNTVVDALVADPNYSALVSLVQTAGLTDTLKNMDSTFTIFAPTNAAIAAADTALQAGFTSDPAALSQLLLGHVHTAGKLSSGDVVGLSGGQLSMANGENKSITLAGDSVKIGVATIVAVDMPADNGVIHGIDTVLID